MAFPTIPTVAAGRIVSNVQANTTATRTFPAMSGLTKASGDLLIAICIAYQTSTGTNAAFSGWSDGFTEFHDSATSTTMAIGMAYKWSTGSETAAPTVTQAGTITGHAAMFILCIPGAHATTPPEAGSRASGTGAANPAAFDPAGWAAEDTLWIAVAGSGETSTTGSYTALASAPANYTDYVDTGISADAVGGVEGAVAFRQLNAASEDVGTFTGDTSNARDAVVVIAVRPTNAVTLDAGSNTVTITANAQSQLAEITLAAGANTVTVSAPAQNQLAEVTLAAGVNTVAVTAPDATGVFDAGSTNLAAGQNTITVSAPDVPAVHLTAPQGTNTITVSAPTAELIQILNLAAGQNTITVSAPTIPAVHLTIPQTANIVTVTAPSATMFVGIQNKKNLLLWSEDFTNAVWTSGAGTGATVTANDTTAPDGTTTADKLTEDTSGLFHTVASYSQITFPHDRTYVNASVHVKPNTLSYIALIMSDNSAGSTNRNYIFQGFYLSGAGQLIDAATGLGVNAYYGDVSTAGPHSASIEALANGWYRISAGGFIEKPSTGFNLEIALGKPPVGVPVSMDAEQYFDYTGVSGSLWLWGAQVEAFTNKSQYIKTTSTTITNDVLTFGGVSIAVTAPTAVLDQNLLSAGQNTVTISAPTVPSLALTIPQDVNTVTVSAPDATLQGEVGPVTLQAGQNTVTISAPTVPSVALTIPQTANVITVSAPEETILAETTLTAGQNTITLSAPAQSQLVEATLTAGQNTITVSAPEETVLTEVTLAAGQNTITVSAPTVPSLALTIPQTVNTISVTAPNAEIIQAGNLLAENNVITITAPAIPAVSLTVPQTANVITLTAPEETVFTEVTLSAGQNTVSVSAPVAAMQVDSVVSAGANLVTVSAPAAALVSLDQTLEALTSTVTVTASLVAAVHRSLVADVNAVAVTAPVAGVTITFDSNLSADAGIVIVRAPIVTVQPQYGGDTVYRETARLRITQHETIKV